MKRILISASLFALTLTAGAQGSFITDTQYRAGMESLFNQRIKTVGKKFYNTKKEKLTADEQEALKFLYAYMPLADVTDYPTSFYADNVRLSFKARNEMSWGKNVPELLFRHFVLPIRVNNEPLDASRAYFYKELKERIKNLSMHDAILEINHWCHEKVTYQPADARTSSPLQTLRTATGRCGEQSTFAVAALRAMGIPARQVYTPRWAHTDDNHAWVEAWADGKWYFLGACEPEPVLNLGWFNAPASRAMLMHTRAFGNYNGPEEVLQRTNNFTEINLTSNYAPTAEVKFVVKDTDGKPVNGAKVEFKIYNYAEFYTAVTKQTDAQGRTSLSAGMGDLLIWASKDGKYGYSKASFGKDNTVTITLNHNVLSDKSKASFEEEAFNIVPPAENAKTPYVSDEMRKENNRRFAYEDSIRKAYTATFLTKEQAEKINPRAAEYLVKSRGNKKTIIDFLARHKDNEARALGILATLSDKDLRDIPTEILEDNFTAKTNQLSPRVEDEMITIPFKNYIEKAFAGKTTEMFRKDPTALVTWINKNIRIAPEYNALQIAQTPVGVMESKTTDERSRDIFFVDVARSLGIEARKDVVTGKVQYMKDGKWMDVKFDSKEQATAPTGKLVLTYEPSAFLDDPKYYNHFTISRIVNGSPQLMNFEEGQADMGNGTCWSNTFKNGYSFDTGTYMLTTGTRLANGSVLAATRIFNIEKGKTTTLPLDIRQDANDVSVIGQFNSESIISKDGKDVSILSQTGRGYYILAVLGVGQEPTNHALHDIEKERAAFESWGRPVVLLFESEADAKKFQKDEFGSLPSTVQYAIDKNGAIREQIAREMKLQSKTQMPMFIIADTFNRVVFSSQGYTIGLGEQMKNVFKKLK
ncbi:transglutaminase domain-containing protein [uncultured Prevotella sp.]|uniref:transglutaminase domain-containing protein n=1 Tax=uncultured Prevotella sp. TaxID=159272 RepID=UPI00260473F7|nr:transglutaminase domain-containing protein [uncultured Prevotella sp.]